MKGFVLVSIEGTEKAGSLKKWVGRGVTSPKLCARNKLASITHASPTSEIYPDIRFISFPAREINNSSEPRSPKNDRPTGSPFTSATGTLI